MKMDEYFVSFYNDWNSKVNNIVGNDLSNVFDRFMTLFVIYNSLYNQVPERLIQNGIFISDRIQDNKAATDLVVKFVGADSLITLLRNHHNEINIIIDLIQNHEFNIKLKFGLPQRNSDLQILENLRSTNYIKKSTAILQVIYYVRCNLFHGHKSFKEQQRILVEPLTTVLKSINTILFNTLNI